MKLTIREAVRKLDGNVSAQTLYQAIKGRLPHYRVSGSGRRGKVLIEESDLMAWLEGQKVGADSTSAPAVRRPMLHHLKV